MSVGDGRQHLPVLPGMTDMNSVQAAGSMNRMQSNAAGGRHQRQPGYVAGDMFIAAMTGQGWQYVTLSGRGQFHAKLRRVIQNPGEAVDPALGFSNQQPTVIGRRVPPVRRQPADMRQRSRQAMFYVRHGALIPERKQHVPAQWTRLTPW